jgi:hypothetical protein
MRRFQKGQSGNPAGRPPGSRTATSMVQNLIEGAAENIANRAAQLAQDGNVAAIRICMKGNAHPDDRFFYVSWRR